MARLIALADKVCNGIVGFCRMKILEKNSREDVIKNRII